MEQPDFQKILKEKRDYYGHTEAAIEFAADQYARQMVLLSQQPIAMIDASGAVAFKTETAFAPDGSLQSVPIIKP